MNFRFLPFTLENLYRVDDMLKPLLDRYCFIVVVMMWMLLFDGDGDGDGDGKGDVLCLLTKVNLGLDDRC